LQLLAFPLVGKKRIAGHLLEHGHDALSHGLADLCSQQHRAVHAGECNAQGR